MEKTIRKIESKQPILPVRERVAAYARVSSGNEATLHSLSAQVSYYSNLIQRNPEWHYVGVYVDEAITGTTEKREGFQRMLADCRAGKIDRIITKCMSRFARNTVTLLKTVRELKELGIDVYFEKQNLHVGNKDIRGCVCCYHCKEHGKCVFDDIVNETAAKLEEADGLVIGSPVYYAMANGTLASFVQRLFYSTLFDKSMKVGASVVVARRGGLSSTYDELNKFFGISGMPIASGQYWNSVHGRAPGEAKEDIEGLQGMRTLARNMSFLMKSIALGKEKYGIPVKEKTTFTNFVK